MQDPDQSRNRRSPTDLRIRQRSIILRDGALLMSVAGYPQEVGCVDEKTLAALKIPTVLTAFRIGTKIEARRSRAALARSGTLQKYEQIVQRLAVANRQNDAYAEYWRRQQAGLWNSKSAREEARSALSRHAADQVIMLASPYLQMMIATLPRMADRRIVLRAHKMLIRPRLTRTPALLGDSCFPFESCVELARACRFLFEQQRDKCPSPVMTAPSQAKRKAGKRAVLVALHRHETAMHRTREGFDWRNHFWSHVRRDQYVTSADTARMAALMVTGCRPGEMAGSHSIAIFAENSAAGPVLRVYITGAKIFRPSEIDTDDNPIVQPVETDRPSEADRGQPWRELTIACCASEALWLHRHVLTHGHIESDSLVDCPTGTRPACMHLSLRDPATHKSEQWLHPVERSRRAVVAFSKTISRIGKLAFPKLDRAVTPYVFRHAFATDLRASGAHSAEAIAQALGHLSMRSMSAYGTRGTTRPGARTHAVREVKAPIAPRLRQDTHQQQIKRHPVKR